MKKLSRQLVGMVTLLILLMLILGGIFTFGKWHFQTHFFSGTRINGINVGEMTVDDARYAIQNRIRDYTLTCSERNGYVEKITGDQIYMQYVDDGAVQKLMDSQNTSLWLLYLGRGKSYTVDLGYTYDKNSIDTVMSEMQCFNTGTVVAPSNAKIEESGNGFIVTESQQGNLLDRDKTRYAIVSAIENSETAIDFEALDLYQKPSADSDDAGLQAVAADLNRMMQANIVYDFVDRQFTVDGSVVRTFLDQDEDGNYVINRGRVAEWVYQLAYDTDTYGLRHKFTTTTGATIELEGGGDYGWCINQESTVMDLIDAIQRGLQETREPVYLYRAMDRSTNDIGGTYVEICIERQEMWCYQNGVLVVDTPVVTGNHAAGLDTPSGKVWAIDLKEKDATFRANGNVKVKYWLPFEASCGIHDASWRTEYEFGNLETWKYNGSDGCVNTPEGAAATIFEIMDTGFPVIVYYSEAQPVGTQPVNEILPG